MITKDNLIDIGFNEIPHYTVSGSLIYPLGRHRHLSVACVGSPNEMLFISESDHQDEKHITDIICLHNYDYDGYLTIKKILDIINSITQK
jgi:hypothetical protein